MLFKRKVNTETITKHHKESEDFLDDEYERTYKAKKLFLGRTTLEQKHQICEHIEMTNFLMDDHARQYEDI